MENLCSVLDRQTYQVLVAIFGILWFFGLVGYMEASARYYFNKSFTVFLGAISGILWGIILIPYIVLCYLG